MKVKHELIGYAIWLLIGLVVNMFTDGVLSYFIIALWICFYFYFQVVFEWSFYKLFISKEFWK